MERNHPEDTVSGFDAAGSSHYGRKEEAQWKIYGSGYKGIS